MFRPTNSMRLGKARGMKVKHLVQVVALTVLFTWFLYQFNHQRVDKVEDVDDELLITDPGAIADSRFLIDRNEVVQTAEEVGHDEFIDRQSVRQSLRKYRFPPDETSQLELSIDEADRVNGDVDDSLEGDGDGIAELEKHMRLNDEFESASREDKKGIDFPEEKKRSRKELVGERDGDVIARDEKQQPGETGTISRESQKELVVQEGGRSIPELEEEKSAFESPEQDIFDQDTEVETNVTTEENSATSLPPGDKVTKMGIATPKVERLDIDGLSHLASRSDGKLAAISQHRSGAVLTLSSERNIQTDVDVAEREPGEYLYKGLDASGVKNFSRESTPNTDFGPDHFSLNKGGKPFVLNGETVSSSHQDSKLQLAAAISDVARTNSSFDGVKLTPANLPSNLIEEKQQLEANATQTFEHAKIEPETDTKLTSKNNEQNQSSGIAESMK